MKLRFFLLSFLLLSCDRVIVQGTFPSTGPMCLFRLDPKYEPPSTLCKTEAECFCLHCFSQCKMGMKECTYSSATIWGVSPASCVCR